MNALSSLRCVVRDVRLLVERFDLFPTSFSMVANRASLRSTPAVVSAIRRYRRLRASEARSISDDRELIIDRLLSEPQLPSDT